MALGPSGNDVHVVGAVNRHVAGLTVAAAQGDTAMSFNKTQCPVSREEFLAKTHQTSLLTDREKHRCSHTR